MNDNYLDNICVIKSGPSIEGRDFVSSEQEDKGHTCMQETKHALKLGLNKHNDGGRLLGRLGVDGNILLKYIMKI
jgi:hypothetical protein